MKQLILCGLFCVFIFSCSLDSEPKHYNASITNDDYKITLATEGARIINFTDPMNGGYIELECTDSENVITILFEHIAQNPNTGIMQNVYRYTDSFCAKSSTTLPLQKKRIEFDKETLHNKITYIKSEIENETYIKYTLQEQESLGYRIHFIGEKGKIYSISDIYISYSNPNISFRTLY